MSPRPSVRTLPLEPGGTEALSLWSSFKSARLAPYSQPSCLALWYGVELTLDLSNENFFLKFFLFLPKDIFPIAFSERGREREKHQCERETSIGCLLYAPGLGNKPTTQACAQTGNQTHSFSVTEQRSNQLSHVGQG